MDIPGPAGSGAFGTSVTVLPNGNIVVTDPAFDAPGPVADVGAVYLYSAAGVLISTLTGSAAGDQVGSLGVTVLTNGNYVVNSPSCDIGAINGAGAVTWCAAATGINGVVSAANSLVGSSTFDSIGSDNGISGVKALANGNYVVLSQFWQNATPLSVGALTWCNGSTGTSGTVSAANSLVGSSTSDMTSPRVTTLSNGNYVLVLERWNNGVVVDAGSVTWGNGATGTAGVISAANSLVGSTTNDRVGGGGVTELTNGNYVVRSFRWANGAASQAGAVTWGSGTAGVAGVVSAANSLVGSAASDQVGVVTPLTNGNYVVQSQNWDNGALANVGASTWADGTTGISGPVSSANSLIGTTANDGVSSSGIVALTNGNYVVCSGNWDNGAVINVGAATWCAGTAATVGTVSAANSLVGTTTSDGVGGSAAALTNGNYVVISMGWDNGAIADVGAVTWCNGTTGVVGSVTAANSLIGSAASDFVGSSGVTALTNGNYVVISPGVGFSDTGAVTWCNGTTGRTGTVTGSNSLVGTGFGLSDTVGSGGVTALTNGNYVASSPLWDAGISAQDVGAVTWCSGTTGRTGGVASSNSLVGSIYGDQVGTVTGLPNGHYIVTSRCHVNFISGAGAITWGSGTAGVTGAVSAANSLVGGTANDTDSTSTSTTSDGNLVAKISAWDNGAVINSGAVALVSGTGGTIGAVTQGNSVRGTAVNGGSSLVSAYDAVRQQMVVGRRLDNMITIFTNAPDIAVEQPAATALTDGVSTVTFLPVLTGTSTTRQFTIKNIGNTDLTGLGITINGTHSADFSVTVSPTAPVAGPAGSTTFTVQFLSAAAGIKTAALHIASNDPDENAFDIALSARALTPAADDDADGVTNAEEIALAASGFDPVVNSSTLLTLMRDNGLYRTADVQALFIGTPLIQKNPTTSVFTLTIGVEKSTNLINFNPFPMTAPQTTINGAGKLEFQFTAPDTAAFFMLRSQ